MPLRAPSPLTNEHRFGDFRCSAPEPTRWLLERAQQNQASGASRCFVVCDEQQQVVGYYVRAADAISHEDAPGRIRRNRPDPVPIIVLGRLAVRVDRVGRGIGQGLLKDAVVRHALICSTILKGSTTREYVVEPHGATESFQT